MNREIPYEHLLDGMNDAVLIMDLEGDILKVNDAAIEGYGYSREELESMKFQELLSERAYSSFEGKLDEVKERGELRFNTQNITKHGEKITVEVDASVIDLQGDKAILAVARDITEQEELRQSLKRSEEKYENLLDRVLEGVFIINKEGYVKEMNRSGLKIVGYDKDELLSKRIGEILPEDSIVKLQKTLEEMEEGSGVSSLKELKVERKDGSKIWVETKAAFMGREKNPDLIQGVFRDITERKRAEKELEEKNKALKKLLDERENIIKRLSHDLKTPVSPLVNLLPLIKESVEGEVEDERVFRDLDVCYKNALYLKDLLEHILKIAEFSRSGRRGESETVDLSALIDDWIEEFKDRSLTKNEEKNINIINNIDPGLNIKLDKMGFYEVLENLVRNSIEHMPDGGNVTFEAKEQENDITVKVEDTGTGMKEKEIDQAFEYFYTKGESNHRLESTGLGLPISRYIIENHGGEIWAENKECSGSRFCIELPKEGGVTES